MSLSQFNSAKVLVTGHSGFKGAWLTLMLEKLGADVFGYSLDVPENGLHVYHELDVPGIIKNKREQFGDVRDAVRIHELIRRENFDFVFHLAAQAIVSKSYKNPGSTIETNLMGTLNVLDALRFGSLGATTVMVTSDKCYENDGRYSAYVESDRLGGKDPYSASKAAAEIVCRSYFDSYQESFTGGIATARAGNVFGGGDWSVNRLIPDLVQSLSSQSRVMLRMPEATRPWTRVTDIVSGYLLLAASLRDGSVPSRQAWNFASGEVLTVLEVAREFVRAFGLSEADAIEVSGEQSFAEADLLQIEASKAHHQLGWWPIADVRTGLRETAAWYKTQSEGKSVKHMSANLIGESLRAKS